jgi:hypothetical protein
MIGHTFDDAIAWRNCPDVIWIVTVIRLFASAIIAAYQPCATTGAILLETTVGSSVTELTTDTRRV